MHNINVVVKPDETATDIIEQICLLENIESDDQFAFCCIMKDTVLKINCIEPKEANPYTVRQLITKLFKQPEKNPRYVVAPLEQYLISYKPLLYKMVNNAYPYYQKLIPDKQDMMSILFLSIVKLYNKGYYLHNHLIYKSFINELNLEVRKTKNFQDCISLNTVIGYSSFDTEITLMDMIQDPEAHLFAEYTEKDYWEEMYEKIKDEMLEDIGKFAFDRILILLKSKSIDCKTSRILSKYREIYNPGYKPRPNARKEKNNE